MCYSLYMCSCMCVWVNQRVNECSTKLWEYELLSCGVNKLIFFLASFLCSTVFFFYTAFQLLTFSIYVGSLFMLVSRVYMNVSLIPHWSMEIYCFIRISFFVNFVYFFVVNWRMNVILIDGFFYYLTDFFDLGVALFFSKFYDLFVFTFWFYW